VDLVTDFSELFDALIAEGYKENVSKSRATSACANMPRLFPKMDHPLNASEPWEISVNRPNGSPWRSYEPKV
jgi:hypothetical protein